MQLPSVLAICLLSAGPLLAQTAALAVQKPVYQHRHSDATITRPSPDEPTNPFSPRLAVDYLEQGAVAPDEEYSCVS